MGMYVKDATAPKNCTGCIAVHYYMSMAGDAGMLCEVTGLRMDDYYSGGRPDWCSLIEVPEPHGDLIDRDALSKSLNRLCDRVCQYSKAQRKFMCNACPLGDAFTVVEDDAPTIIPASEEA